MSDLELRGVTKAYGGTTVLDTVDLTVEDGEFFTLVGPSGCGKTTTLRTIAGFEEPDAGEVLIGDKSAAGVRPEDRDIGVVFQNYALFPHMSVAENVAYGLRFSDPPGGASRDERVAELLSLVDLEGFEDRDPDELSGGQRQRVALARALAPGPDLLLLDEPMSALDARLRKRLRRQVQAIQSDLGVTTIYVTHDQSEALAISDRLAVMNRGRVEQVGTPRDVYRRPETRFVADFLGDNNVFEGAITAADNGRSTLDIDGREFRIPRVDADRATVCVRPEAVRLLGDGESGVDANRLRTDVVTTEFLGGAVRAGLRWRDRTIVAHFEDAPDAETVTVAFDPDDVHVVGSGAEVGAVTK
ncbi:thiamine transport system ATP-binding protein [Natronoarchaeum philippinense]|uniref:Molybdate/tungstate import ATP-binding protein WtpC n=1 Tax=Natronoarchaeum philippinense TaxID=558529 RepID=A0A285P0B1_NATPI|nr:ABC transporter ATP-binding protein [Natronoarchaeum philippinense]SNZ15149.1 thiamine transport system ATP-binding protein [Natronoarchaeum philippinense]